MRKLLPIVLFISAYAAGRISAVKTLIKLKGKKAVAKTLSRVVTAQAKKSKIKASRGVTSPTVMGTMINTALNYLDIETSIAKLIDNRNWYPKNGYMYITE